jgi:hypothetical protein
VIVGEEVGVIVGEEGDEGGTPHCTPQRTTLQRDRLQAAEEKFERINQMQSIESSLWHRLLLLPW